MALQAPPGSNVVTMRFVVVRDEAKRRAVGDVYREVYAGYKASPYYAGKPTGDDARDAVQQRVAGSADFLGEHMGDAPVLVLACNEGPDRAGGGMGNVIPAMWSFMLAARARALGTSWTSMHLARERDVAEILGLDYETSRRRCSRRWRTRRARISSRPGDPLRARSSAGSRRVHGDRGRPSGRGRTPSTGVSSSG